MIVVQLEQALTVAEKDTKDASEGVMKDLRRFQSEKENDVRRYMVSPPFLFLFLYKSVPCADAFCQMEFAQCHLDWARRNKAAWEEARAEVNNIQHPADEYPRSSVDM